MQPLKIKERKRKWKERVRYLNTLVHPVTHPSTDEAQCCLTAKSTRYLANLQKFEKSGNRGKIIRTSISPGWSLNQAERSRLMRNVPSKVEVTGGEKSKVHFLILRLRWNFGCYSWLGNWWYFLNSSCIYHGDSYGNSLLHIQITVVTRVFPKDSTSDRYVML